jgi:amidophosphoribosyltransferase
VKEAAPRSGIGQPGRRIFLDITPINAREKSLSKEVEQEDCGIVGFFNPNGIKPGDLQESFMQGMTGVKHRGPQGAGFVLRTTDGRVSRHTGAGKLEESIPTATLTEAIAEEKVTWMMGHTRYGTSGGYLEENIQPRKSTRPDGTEIYLATNGNIPLMDTMKQMLGRDDFPEGISDTYLAAEILAQTEGETNDAVVKKFMAALPGAASTLIGIGDTFYAARDANGIRPFVLGRNEDGTWMMASETLALDNAGFEAVREILPGEIVRFDGDDLTVVQEGSKKNERKCAWEEPYFMKETSKSNVSSEDLPPSEWVENSIIRREIGRQLAKEEIAREEHKAAEARAKGEEYTPFKPDAVVGVPNSGMAFADGYAEAMGVPLVNLLSKNTDDRTFLNQNLDAIQNEVIGSLVIHDLEQVRGMKLAFVDDSIVRGNFFTGLAKKFEEYDVEVHARSGMPMIVETCHLGTSTRNTDELVAARHKGNEQAIAQEIGVASVQYISTEGFLIGRRGELYVEPKANENPYDVNGLCGGCFTEGAGDYPYPREEVRSSSPIDVFVRPTSLAS